MALQSKNNFLGGINLDLDNLRIPANTAIFIKNLTSNANQNASAAAGAGSNQWTLNPLEGNQALTVTGMPSGQNYCIGSFSSEQTNEGYFAVYNSNNNHTIWVISGDDGTVRKVHESALLPFVLDPQYFLSEGRITVELRSIIDPVSGLESNFKFLVFTNNREYQCLIDVEASIATNSYTTPYFTTSAATYNPLELILLGSVLPIKCVKLNDPNAYVPQDDATAISTVTINVAGTGYAVGDTFSIGSSTAIASILLNNGGAGYAVGDTFSVNGGTGGQGRVTAIGISGIATAIQLSANGTGYSIATGVATTPITGTGSGLTINILSLITLASGQVTNIGSGGSVTTFILTNGGSGFTTGGPIITTATTGAGSGLMLNVVALVIPDTSKQNLIINEGWQFRIRTWDVWGRPSEWGIISSIYTALIGGGCISTSNGLPRCVNICFDAGNPLVKYITIAYRRGVGNDPTGETETSWFEHETFAKYDDSQAVEWYQRQINQNFSTAGSGMAFNSTTNIITYTFCADKQSNPVDPTEAARTEPGIARLSSSVFSIDKVLGLANNVYDFEQLPQPVIDNVQFSVKPPGTSVCPAPPSRTITVYAVIYDPVAVLAGEHYQGYCRTSFGQVGFGRSSGNCGSYSFFAVDQVFGDQTNPGFIGVFRGTNINTIAHQGDFDPATGNFVNVGFVTPPSTGVPPPSLFPHMPIQQFIFTDVPAGKYIMQIASHKSKSNDSDLQQTSTYVGGIGNISDLNSPTGPNSFASNPLKEIEIDCTNGDVVLNGYQPGQTPSTTPLFIILDMVINSLAFGNGSAVLDGYLYEQNGQDGPIEMSPVYFQGATLGAGVDVYGSFFTDHNGFYFGVTDGNILRGYFYADVCDGAGTLNRRVYGPTDASYPYMISTVGGIVHGDGTGTVAGSCTGVHGNWRNKIYLYPTAGTYPDAARRRVKQTINLCTDPLIGVPGIPMVMTKVGPFAITDSNGQGTIIAHNRYNYLNSIAPFPAPWLGASVPDYSTSPNNQDKLIFSQKGGCEWNACGTCNTSMADVIITYLACSAISVGCPPFPPQPARTICLATLTANPNGIGVFGVQSGGKYPVSFWVHDVIGRHTSPQIRGGELGYVYVPNINDIAPFPYPNMALCALQVTIPPGLTVDPVFKHITFLVGSNCLFTDYFSWAADWIQYIDNTGATNPTNPTAVRIYFQSLNEYNKQYNFGTNIGWDFITTQEQTDASTAAPADVVQFIMNGDGTFLNPQKGAPITYDKSGSFFTINFIPELAGLQNGCLFRVIRPTQNIIGTSLPYYEQCLTLDINNGVLPTGTFVIPYQDSYMLSRAIPVPLMKGQPTLIPPNSSGTAPNPILTTNTNQDPTLALDGYSTNNIDNNNGVLIFQTLDKQATYPFFFESPSPSDLWGSHLQSKGRVGIPDPYEQQYRVGTEIALSNPLADLGIVNGVGVYLDQNKQVFDRNTFGDITVVLVEMGVCMVICNNDFFITRYNQTQIQITDNGQVVGQNPQGSIFTAPQTKVGANFGVTMSNINTIQRYYGTVIFLDKKGHLIFSDFSSAKPTEKDGYLGYLLNKIGYVNNSNNNPSANGQTYFTGGIDPKTMEYNLTSFHVSAGGLNSYINTQSQPALQYNETLIFDMATAILKSFASYTPEYYLRIPGYYAQRQFLSFQQGFPFIHHANYAVSPPTPPLYCNFYGTQCEVRITHVINGVDGKQLPDKVKRFLWNEVFIRQSILGAPGTMPSALFYADVILSEKGQTSRLLVARWTIKDGFQTAAFICASNTPTDPNNVPATTTNAILDGDPLQGRWCQVSLTNNPLWQGTYFEVSETVSYTNGVEKTPE